MGECKITIIKLSRKNFEDMVQVDKESKHPIDSMINLDYSKMLEKRFKIGNEKFFGYVEDGKLKGYISLIHSSNTQCKIYWLAVKKNFQRDGIGTKLIKFAEQYTNQKGFGNLLVCTNKQMGIARKFYENLGFEFSATVIGYYNYPNPKYNTAICYSVK